MTTVVPEQAHQGRAVPRDSRDVLALWAAEGQNRHRTGNPCPGRRRFVFYGRVSTEDWQDPVTSRTRQREQAEALVRGHGVIVAEFFDVGESRTVAWARRPRAAALVAQLADPGIQQRVRYLAFHLSYAWLDSGYGPSALSAGLRGRSGLPSVMSGATHTLSDRPARSPRRPPGVVRNG